MATTVEKGQGNVGAAAPPRTWWPGLEGLRGIGMVFVLVAHQDASIFPGAFLSVSMFFTMSGFLITSLLLREQAREGRLDITRFWKRRVRRLLPVAMAGLLLASLVAWATRSSVLLPSVVSDIRYAALNLANWRFIRTDTSYTALLTAPSTVTHYWSLAIEEQYYFVYPVLAFLALRWRGRQGLGIALAGVTALSFAAQLLSPGGDRAYFGTDTRLAELAIGGLAAVLWTPAVRERLRRHLDVVGAVAGIAMLTMWWRYPLDSPSLWRGVMLGYALLVSVVLVCVVDAPRISRLTSWSPLVWFGGLSYPCYVVHLPVFLYLDADRVGFGGVGLFAVRVGVSVGLAVALKELVERPVRFGGAFQSWQAPMASVSLIACVLLVATALPHVGRKADALETFAVGRKVSPTLEVAPVPVVDTLPPPTPAEVADDGGDPAAVEPGGPGTTATTREPARALKLLVAGDSTAGVWGAGMQEWGTEHGFASADRSGGPGCVLHAEGVAALRPGWNYTPSPGCTLLADLVVSDAQASKPDAIVLIIGSLQLADWVAGPGVAPVGFGDAGFDARYRAAFSEALDKFSGLDVPILVATIPIPRWDPVGAPGTGDLTMNNPARTAILNRINAEVVAEHSHARMVPFADAVDDASGRCDPALHPDGLHIDEHKVPGVMDAGLAEAMRKAYRSEIEANPSTRRPGSTIWHR